MNEIQLLKEEILKVISAKKYEAMTAEELAGMLDVPESDMEMFKRVLAKMTKDGQIVLIHGARYTIGEVADLIAGMLSVSKAGNGYLAVKGRETDLFIPQRNMGVGLPGDRVLVRIEVDKRNKGDAKAQIGRVIEVLERKRRDIVGTLKSTGRFNYVVPVAPGYSKNFYIDDLNGAKINDRVVVRFTDWVDKNVNPEGTIIDVIGSADDPSVDTISIIKQYELPQEFPDEVLREAETASARMENPDDNRLDIRDKLIVTIDPETARDFDDALSLETDSDGNMVLGVHIADVSHFVTPGSALDEEARIRGNSVYLPDLVIPMLPEQLSNGVCSLRPDEDRFAFSVFMTMSVDGIVLKSEFARTIIRSKVRFTYEEAMAWLESGSAEHNSDKKLKDISQETITLLHNINRLAKKLRKRRFAKHALVMNLPECEVIYDGEGHIKEIRGSSSDESHQLVEECMVAANEAVDVELSKQGMALIHRFHAKPAKKKIDELKIELEDMGFSPGNLNVRKNLSRFMKQILDDPLAYYAQIAILRSMSRAIYSESDAGHYGLAKSFYAHFTSPIRRYPDLVVHRQLGELLLKNKNGIYNKTELSNIAEGCSRTERNAEEAERELLEIKKFRFLAEQLKAGNPHTYDAVVSRVTNFGMFVDVPSLQLQGLIHVSTVSDKFVRHDAKNDLLRSGKTVYKRGTQLKVIVAFVDFDKSRIDFTLATSPKDYFSRSKSSGKRRKSNGKPWHADASSGSRGKKGGSKKGKKNSDRKHRH